MNASRPSSQPILLRISIALGMVLVVVLVVTPDSLVWLRWLAAATLVTVGAAVGVRSRRTRNRLLIELEHRAEEMKISAERHRLLLAQASDAIIVADPDTGLIVEANDYACKLLGWSAEELVGQRHTVIHAPENRPFARHAFAEQLKREGITETEVIAKHKLGELIPLQARTSVITVGSRRFVQAIFRDLRPRLSSEEALRRSEARIREVFERAPVGIFETDFSPVFEWLSQLRTDGVTDIAAFVKVNHPLLEQKFRAIRLLSANPAALRILGAENIAELTAHISRGVSEETIREFGKILQAIWEGKSEFVADARMRRLDGARTNTAVHWSVPVVNGAPEYRRAILVLSDLTQLRAAEERMRQAESRWELAVRALNVGVFEQNYSSGETYLSDRWKQILGFNPDELGRGLHEWRNRLHPEDRESVMAEIQAHLRGETEFYRVDCRMMCKDGSYKWVTSHGRAIFDAAGTPQRLIGADTDISERKLAEERLRASEERHRRLFENAAEGVCETTLEGEFRAVNPALARMMGYRTPKDFLAAQRTADHGFYVKPNRRTDFFAALGNNDAITAFESEIFRADGSTRWISESVRAVRDEHGQVKYLQCFISDITERKRAEEAIRASEERYRVLFEHSPVAVVEYNYRKVAKWLLELRAKGIADLSAYLEGDAQVQRQALALAEVVGLNAETVRLARAGSKQELLENFDRIFGPDGHMVRKEMFLAMWEGRPEVEGEVTINALDGSTRRAFYRWWLPSLESGQNLEWTQVVMVDLTDIRSTEAELAAERERLRVTLRAIAEGLLTTDTTGIVQFMNEAAERITGWTAGAAIGRSVEQVCVLRHEKTRADVLLPVARAISEHRVIEFPLQTTLYNRQGSSCLVDGRCAPMHDLMGEAIGAVVVFRDVTERARLEAELMRSSKLESIGILAGGIAHDFNNILAVVMGNVTLAMLDPQVMEICGRWLSEAERGVMRARDLTQQLLTFAKGGEPVRKAVQLPEVVRDAAEFALHGSKVRCEFTSEPNLWAADVDKAQVGQVIHNLVINAVQAMPEGGIVRISMRNEAVTAESSQPLRVGSYLRLGIADSGIGIKSEHLARIFDPYFTTKQSGSGLGLATVYSIVRRHQGHIEVESELGHGTRFHIWLPAAPDAIPVQAEAADKVTRLAGRVLFMDDEETIRVMAKSLLERLGMEVVTTADGAEAVAAFQKAREQGAAFQVVMMDLTVPGGMGGLEALEQLRKIDPNVKAIVSSGYSSDPVMASYRAYGFRGMVPKPYKFTDLARTLRTVIAEQ